MKKLATVVSAAALFAAAVIPAIGAGNNCSSDTTGPFSTNYCTVNNSSNVTVTNTNTANVNNDVTARSNSGNNSASYNTLGGAITTGNATLNATVGTVANINTTTVSGGPAGSSNNGSNSITGPYSDNRATFNNLQTVTVNNVNEATVNNTVNVTADSGSNLADYNTGPASVATGNSRLGLAVNNHLNDSATGISAGAGGTGGNSGANSTTGPFSTDYVTINNTATATVTNPNTLYLDNIVDALSRSGNNSASYNTLGGEIGTGSAGAGVGINNEGNISTTTVQMAMGGFANDGSNGVTGPYSDNRLTLLNTLGITVTNPNTSTVNNTDNDTADSGSNVSDYNTGGGGVMAGLSDLVKSILNHLNDSLTVIQ